jgi:hypothetical protein
LFEDLLMDNLKAFSLFFAILALSILLSITSCPLSLTNTLSAASGNGNGEARNNGDNGNNNDSDDGDDK